MMIAWLTSEHRSLRLIVGVRRTHSNDLNLGLDVLRMPLSASNAKHRPAVTTLGLLIVRSKFAHVSTE